MVMEETPNPQCVGREFVRQYYTMLNKAPIQMHRFYSESSSFVHGGMGNGESVAVYGQQQIHARIMQLQYRDCHAKIRQVDSHSTLSNGVVVQVSGELSNNGMPMRKFMQTFVLAPLAPKNYYVHNDIFMYQDEVFSDEETPEDANQTEVEQETPTPIKVEEATVNNESPDTSINETTEDISGVGSWAAEPSEMMTGGLPVVTGEESVVAPVSHQTMLHDDSPPLSPPPDMQASLPHDEQPKTDTQEIMSPISDGALDYETAMEPEPEPSETKQPVITEPKTFAERVKAGGLANFTAPQANQTSPYVTTQSMRNEGFGQQHQAARMHRPRPGAAPPGQRGPGTEPPRDNRPYRGYDDGPRGGESEYSRRPLGGSTGQTPPGGGGSTGGGPGISQMYNDRQQVFVGNLPLSVTEDDLKAVFEKFGRIVDCHINNKPKPSLQSGQKPPNFGFVIFDEVNSVQKVLEHPTLYLGSNRLNVEEKKTRTAVRPPSMDGRLGGGRGGGMPQRMGNQPRGQAHRGGRGAPANRGSYNSQRIK